MALSPLSFHPSSLIGPYAAGSTLLRSSGFPDWVLLCKSARISEFQNATTARCHTAEGQAVEVSFWLVDPPGVSYFSVNCPGLEEDDFSDEPVVICAAAAFVLFCVALRTSTHHFVYTASGGPAGKPSLHLLPDPEDPRLAAFRAKRFGLLPCGDDHYAVVFLARKWTAHDQAWRFDAHVFSSKTQAWRSSKASLLQLSESDKLLCCSLDLGKQITVGASSLGWVDLRGGILLLSDIFDEHPILGFIPFPASRVRIWDSNGLPYDASEYYCYVACCDDLIKFVEIDFDDPDGRMKGKGWRSLRIWERKISWSNWHKGATVDVADISVDQSYSVLSPELWDDETQELELKKLVFYVPILSMHNDDLLYMLAKVNDEDDNAWVIAVDMKRAAVEALAPFSIDGKDYLVTVYCPCAFPKYLNMTPGADMPNPVDEYFKRMSAAYCVVPVLWTQDCLREVDQFLETQTSTYNVHRLLLQYCPDYYFSIVQYHLYV